MPKLGDEYGMVGTEMLHIEKTTELPKLNTLYCVT